MAFSWSSYYTSSSYNPYASFDDCMPNCTCYAYGRAREMGLSVPVNGAPGASSWPSNVNTSGGWSVKSYDGNVKRGDIIVYANTHVAICESSSSVTGSWYTGYRGYSMVGKYYDPRPANSYWAQSPKGGALTVYVGSTVSDVMNWGSNYQSNRFYHSGTPDNDGAGAALYVLVAPGEGGGSEEDPGGGGGTGHWENILVDQTPVDYTGTIYECGVGVFGDQSGTQDTPQAPTVIHPGGGRERERWEPFIMYTDERVLTYTADGQPIWSNWETKYTGSENFDLGSQPTYGNGWEMEWQGDDD